MKMIQRPKLGETEDDLLEQQQEFLKASGKLVKYKRQAAENEEKSSSKGFEIVVDIKERATGILSPYEFRQKPTKGFPHSFRIDPLLVQKKRGKKSLFALQLEKTKKGVEEKMEVDETGGPAQNFGSYTSSTCKSVHEENMEKLSKMTGKEILEEQKKLLDTLDPNLVSFLKNRGKEKVKIDELQVEQMETSKTVESDEQEVKKNLEKYVDSKWINIDFLEKEKLEWIGDIPDKKALEPDQPYSARFNFSGELQPFMTEIDVRNSLYHHGDEPNRPGYTIQELYQLSRSQVLQQRILALNTLANIVRKTKLGYYDRCFDGQLLHKLVDSDFFFLVRFSIDENSLLSSSVYCLYNLLCNESDEYCLDKLLGVTNLDEQPLLFSKMEASTDEEKELKDHLVIGCDMIKGVLRTDLLMRLSYVLSNFSPTRETVVRVINCLIRVSRHSLEATAKILETPNLLKIVYNNIKNPGPIYEGVKLFRVMISQSKEVTAEIVRGYDLHFLVSFIEAEENVDLTKKEFYLLKLETMYLWRGLLLHDFYVNDFLMWSPCLIRLLLFYTQKVNVNAENDFDFELFSAMTSLIIVCNRKKISYDPNTLIMMRICLEKWLTQVIQLRQYNFAVSKALGCAFRYFTSYFKSFGVTALDLEFVKKINSILASLFQSEAFDTMSASLRKNSYLLSASKVSRDPDNLPSLSSVYDGGEEFLKIVQNTSALPFFISLTKYLKMAHEVSRETKSVIKLFADSANVRKYTSKVCQSNEVIYNWFMKFETGFLSGVLELFLFVGDEEALRLAFSIIPLMRVDDKKCKKVFEVVCDKSSWKVEAKFLDHLASLYYEILSQRGDRSGAVRYKNDLFPEDWTYKILSLLRGKEAVEAVSNTLKFISLILTQNPDLVRKVSHTLRFYNLCSVFLTDSNVFDSEIQNSLEVAFRDVVENREKVNLNVKYDKNKSFYDLYTELVTQYAGVSYGLPIFAKFVLFPLRNRYSVSLRKLLWFEYMHVLRVVTLPFPLVDFVELNDFLNPCETDESLLVTYISSLANNVILKSRNPFVYNIAIGNVNNFINSLGQEEKLLTFLKKAVGDLQNDELRRDILDFRIS